MRKDLLHFFLVLFLVFSLSYVTIPAIAEESTGDDGWDDYGDEDDPWESFDSIDSNFPEIEADIDTSEPTENPSIWYLGGYVKEDLAYAYAHDTPEFSEIKTTLGLTLDLDISEDWKARFNINTAYNLAYTLIGRDRFSSEVLDEYEFEAELRDAYIDGKLTDWLYLKFGRQIIAWGQSESSQVTDMANPRDMRELGIVDIEDARVPIAATKLTGVFSDWELNLAMTHEFMSHKLAVAGTEFDFLQDIRNLPMVTVTKESTPVFRPEVLFRALKRFNGGDIGLILADTFEDMPYLAFNQFVYSMSGMTPVPSLTLTPEYGRIKTAGLSGAIVNGAWQIKTDIARKTNMPVMRKDFESQINALITGGLAPGTVKTAESNAITTYETKTIHQFMLGIDYSGFTDLTITLEGVVDKIEDYNATLAENEISGQGGLILAYSTLNNTLTFRTFLASMFGTGGSIFRLNVDYDLRDALKLSGGFIMYETESSDSILYKFRKNDRLFGSIKYSF